MTGHKKLHWTLTERGIVVLVILIGALSLSNIYHTVYANGMLKRNDEKLTQTTKMLVRLQRELNALKREHVEGEQ